MSDNEQSNEQITVGVFALRGCKNKNSVRIKHLDNVLLGPGQIIKDTVIKKYPIQSFIHGEVFACNITDKYLISTKKQPLLCIKIFWTKYLQQTLLYKVYLNFTIETKVETQDDFLSRRLSGKYSIDGMIDGESLVLDEIDVFPGEQEMVDKIISLTQTEGMILIAKDLIKRKEEELSNKYEKEFEQFKIPKNVISLRDYKID